MTTPPRDEIATTPAVPEDARRLDVIGERTGMFGRVGYGTTELEARAPGVSAREDGDSFNYGAGANSFFDGQNGVRGDW